MPSHPTPESVEEVVAGSVEKLRTLTPVLVALATLFVAVMQAVNGLPVESIAETLVVGWLLATPVAALLLWPTPPFLPTPGDDTESEADPLARLKARYADGEIDAAEFERRVETMLSADAAVQGGRASVGDAGVTDAPGIGERTADGPAADGPTADEPTPDASREFAERETDTDAEGDADPAVERE